MLRKYIEISYSFLTLLAVKSTEATRGMLPSDDNDAALIPTVDTETVNETHSAVANSTTSISCWDGLSPTDREVCEQSGILTPSCENSQICKRVDDTCGYVCEPFETPKPCGNDGQISKFKVSGRENDKLIFSLESSPEPSKW